MKIISIEEHFLTPEVTSAWATSAIGSEGTDGFDQGEIRQCLEDLGGGPPKINGRKRSRRSGALRHYAGSAQS